MVPFVQSWSEIRVDVGSHWLIYLSMPAIAALVGYGTKLVALQMLYRPLQFRGVGPLGWQGVVPRRAGKTASVTIEMLTEELLRPEEILDNIDPAELVEELREPLTEIVDDLARLLCQKVRPGLWDSIPQVGRNAILARIRRAAPGIVDNLLVDMRRDLGRFVDLQYLAVTILVRNKEQLNALVRGIGRAPMKFIRRSGIYFGLLIGSVQMVAWAYFHNPWIMPAFGFFVGFASDWLALNLIFVPRKRRKIFGLFPVHGVLHSQRDQITQDYARILANDIFSPEVLLEGLLHGPTSDRLLAAIDKEVSAALDDQLGLARPAVTIVIGTSGYRQLRSTVVNHLVDRIPETIAHAKDYAARTLGIEQLIIDKMNQLSPAQYEGILRPVFKEDELLMVTVGAVLGFGVGELQLLMVEHYGR